MPDFSLPQTTTTIARLRQLVQQDLQSGWQVSSQDIPYSQHHAPLPAETFAPVELRAEDGAIVWEAGCQVRWFQQQFVLPHDWGGFPLENLVLRLGLTWWAIDAQIFIDGQLAQAGDLFDSSARVVLSHQSQANTKITVTIRLVSPGHDVGGFMRSHLIYEAPYETSGGIDPGFVADELGVLQRYVGTFHPEQAEFLEGAIAALDWSTVGNQTEFLTELQALRDRLLPLSDLIKHRRFHIMGHAHLDMAWLWEAAETYEVAERTFRSVLQLQQEFPVLTFCHTSPVIYEWLETAHPEVFQAIQTACQAGTWDPVGGMWVEPDVNIVSGESIARQLLYGQAYTQKAFGRRTRVAWLTDSFGFCWQLPQLLTLGGIDYFVTQKLHWNDSTQFPHGAFWWRSPDGTQVFTLMSPPNVTGVMDTNPNTMTDYAIQWEQQTQIPEMFWLPGVGDHGGGPSRDMLTMQQRWAASPFFPQSQFSTSSQYLDLLRDDKSENLPVWNDELYLEFHRGCYTSHADQKWFNRRCENTLMQAELWATIAHLLGDFPFPKPEIEQAWKQVLFNQFHDILPGTSIPEVFVTANQDWRQALSTAQRVSQQAREAIAHHIPLLIPPSPEAQPWLVFNSVNAERTDVIELPWSAEMGAIATDAQGQALPCQKTAEGNVLVTVTVPAIGYTVIWIAPSDAMQVSEFPHEPGLENEYLRVELDAKTGAIARLWDCRHQRNILQGSGNILQFFQDEGQYWDAWNIDPHYAEHPLPAPQLLQWQWLENGPVRQRLRVEWQFQSSHLTQDYILEHNSPLLKMQTWVDWQETHVLLKTAFPLTVQSSHATYEMACGAITRPTKPETPAEKAKWEVAALQWADLGDEQYGVSLLNDCKYGYDAQPNQLRLTLLRSPRWPDPGCDIGQHEFTYAIYPHGGTWQTARTPHWAARLNQPLDVTPLISIPNVQHQPLLPKGGRGDHATPLSKGGRGDFQFFKLDPHLILMAFKPSEQGPDSYILRAYEAYGEAVAASVETALAIMPQGQTNLLEDSVEACDKLRPWQIVSHHLQIKP
ncbi:MAG: alpha-mannosidase [Spirulina sp. SIO3F2]|nr:alpha-mannosidase [Spirulina sp. SIO3F2]